MYDYIWIAGGIGAVTFLAAMFFLVKDLAFANQLEKKKGWYYALPNFLLVAIAIGWFVLAVLLYLSINSQLNG